MDTFAPDFSRFWLPRIDREADQRVEPREDDVGKLAKALEELVDRVNAARCIA
ncbi:MAG TPA: hypothetical protein VNE58_03910 [Casimicrobiaceae bacterium]|nr:hypothetical protein [Casimicrobiaceae bacterium]